MKPIDFKYGRKQETDDEKEENMILVEESEDDFFLLFSIRNGGCRGGEVIYLDSSMVYFSRNLLVLIDNIGSTRMKAHFSYVCWIQEVDGGE
ncbi:hypothetical protein AVEN_104604-1 [Araneus ventricosus]|uniref:Uncharacterized protein n=1 Tax=Araneus ventricosus TaxID=182803 RepID=A0A4Y2BBF7_ARAVE|nr:hypothetical protein AVEN_104604-1 [Araneus ventricosus]